MNKLTNDELKHLVKGAFKAYFLLWQKSKRTINIVQAEQQLLTLLEEPKDEDVKEALVELPHIIQTTKANTYGIVPAQEIERRNQLDHIEETIHKALLNHPEQKTVTRETVENLYDIAISTWFEIEPLVGSTGGTEPAIKDVREKGIKKMLKELGIKVTDKE